MKEKGLLETHLAKWLGYLIPTKTAEIHLKYILQEKRDTVIRKNFEELQILNLAALETTNMYLLLKLVTKLLLLGIICCTEI